MRKNIPRPTPIKPPVSVTKRGLGTGKKTVVYLLKLNSSHSHVYVVKVHDIKVRLTCIC